VRSVHFGERGDGAKRACEVVKSQAASAPLGEVTESGVSLKLATDPRQGLLRACEGASRAARGLANPPRSPAHQYDQRAAEQSDDHDGRPKRATVRVTHHRADGHGEHAEAEPNLLELSDDRTLR
jgi:hypothetical protein